jgi:ABC-2 type transport system ATP-binding protein
VRGAIGVTGQYSAVDKLLTGEENVLLMADLKHLSRRDGKRKAAELLDRFDLVDAARKPAGTYSGGMQRRLDLAMTLVGDPRLIFLDEPTTGLDPRSRRSMWQIVRELVASGVTIFLTTQYLEEADELADRIALLDHGRLIAEGTAEQLKRRTPAATSSSPSPTRTCSTPLATSSAQGSPTPRRSPCRCPATAAAATLTSTTSSPASCSWRLPRPRPVPPSWSPPT